MKTLLRNRKTVYYALPTGKVKQTDAYGNYTGETVESYADPVKYERLSARNMTGVINSETFGLADAYESSFVTSDMSCPITEDTRLWIDTAPYDKDGNLLPHDHVVKAIIPTINAIRILVDNVSVS